MRPSRLLLAAALLLAPAGLAAQNSFYYAVWGSSADDAWVVGSGANAMHWDGTAWSPVALPSGTDALQAVWGTSESDVWAVGDNGRVLRYQNGAWTLSCITLTDDAVCERMQLVAVGGFGPTDVYVAAQSPASDIPGRLYHFDGRRWSSITLPVPFRLTPRSLGAHGAEIVLVGSIRHDPTPRECPANFEAEGLLCVLNVGIIARLVGQQWTVTATSDVVAGGIGWEGLTQADRTVLLFGRGLRVANRRATDAWFMQTSTPSATARGAAAGFSTWTSVAQPAGGGVTRAALFPRGELVGTTAAAFVRRRANSWTVIPVAESTEPGAVTTSNVLSVGALWGASAADVWFAAYDRVLRLEGDVPTLAFESECESLGSRAMGTPNCALFRAAAAPPRRTLPMPSQRQPRP